MAERPTAQTKTEKCQKLYVHEYQLIVKEDLLSTALLESASKNQQNSTIAANSVQNCVSKRKLSQIDCRLESQSLSQYLKCGSDTQTVTTTTTDSTSSTDSVGTIEDFKPSRKKSIKASNADCEKAYQSMLVAYEKSDILENREDRSRLLAYWKSPEAKAKFKNRCTSAFEAEDAICLQNAKTHREIQTCLATIPAD